MQQSLVKSLDHELEFLLLYLKFEDLELKLGELRQEFIVEVLEVIVMGEPLHVVPYFSGIFFCHTLINISYYLIEFVVQLAQLLLLVQFLVGVFCVRLDLFELLDHLFLVAFHDLGV